MLTTNFKDKMLQNGKAENLPYLSYVLGEGT